MYRYSDKTGNVFELLDEGPSLFFSNRGSQPGNGDSATAHVELEKPLTEQLYMELVSAFSAAIDNKVYHRELCNNCSGTILTEEDGQQRRYILSHQSPEMQALEAVLYGAIHQQV